MRHGFIEKFGENVHNSYCRQGAVHERDEEARHRVQCLTEYILDIGGYMTVKEFDFRDEEDRLYRVQFEVLNDGESHRPYGIGATIYADGKRIETTEARNRFFTRAEAEENIKMLCKFQVTPCTLRDVI